MLNLIFATHNNHKLQEVAQLLGDKIQLQSLDNVNITEDIPETANTLEGNARQKAHYIFDRTGANVFADDTGLEVEALGGEPGVFSARYAGPACNSADNITKLLKNLNGVQNRNARFRTVICLILNGKEYLFEGIVNGRIIENLVGDAGFGYDPVFVPDGYNETFAQMSMQLKNSISHRGRAIAELCTFLKNL
ncbi:MAG: non-canonical purine NTP diphosphatase [Salinivirgaceae bacterium]|nr:non-canonical purine NTP diphosphatase [Salinivirgaceae bacterium]